MGPTLSQAVGYCRRKITGKHMESFADSPPSLPDPPVQQVMEVDQSVEVIL